MIFVVTNRQLELPRWSSASASDPSAYVEHSAQSGVYGYHVVSMSLLKKMVNPCKYTYIHLYVFVDLSCPVCCFKSLSFLGWIKP